MPLTWETTTLPSGLRVVTTPMATTEAASINLFVGVGSRSEPRRLNGITHFLEHMVFKGTARRPEAAMIAEAIEGAGGTLNAYTTKEFTCYWNVVPFDHFETALDVASDMLLYSTLAQGEIDRERTVVQQELKRNHDNPQSWASRLVGMAIYGEQPCGWDVGGSVETVAGMDRPDFVDHIARWYRAGNIVLSVAGNVTHAQVVKAAAPIFANVAGGPVPLPPAYDAAVAGERVVCDSRDIDQCTLLLGLPIFGRDDPDRFALRILNDVLGSGMSSRLFTEVRERRGLAYSVGSGYGFLADAGSFTISAGVDRAKVGETVAVCLEQAWKLTETLVPEEELRKARDHSIGRFRLSHETAYSAGQRHGELLLLRDEIESVDSFVEKLRAVTAEDVRAVARRLLRSDLVHCAVVGPKLDEDEVGRVLEAA